MVIQHNRLVFTYNNVWNICNAVPVLIFFIVFFCQTRRLQSKSPYFFSTFRFPPFAQNTQADIRVYLVLNSYTAPPTTSVTVVTILLTIRICIILAFIFFYLNSSWRCHRLHNNIISGRRHGNAISIYIYISV